MGSPGRRRTGCWRPWWTRSAGSWGSSARRRGPRARRCDAARELQSLMDLSGRRVTVMGLGRFGGGLGVSRWLASRGADVLVTDLEPAEALPESVAKLRDLI